MIKGKMGRKISRDSLKKYDVYLIESEANNRIIYATDFEDFLILRSSEDEVDNTHGEIIRGNLDEMLLATRYMKNGKEKLELIEVYEELCELKTFGGLERWKGLV